MRARPLVISALAAGCLLAPASGALGFTSNNFESPSGNILCRYDSRNLVMACMTLNDSFVTAVGLYGPSYKTTGGTFSGGPVLGYGQTWTANRRFRCFSKTAGLTCRSVKTGHGFFLNRTQYRLF